MISSLDRFLALTHYIPLLSPLTCFFVLVKKDVSPFSFFHLKQGATLFLFWFFSIFILTLFPFIGWIIWLALIAASVWGCIMSYKSQMLPIPVIASVVGILPFEKLRNFLMNSSRKSP